MAERDTQTGLPEFGRRTFLKGATAFVGVAAFVAADPLSVLAASTYGEAPSIVLGPQNQPEPAEETLQTGERIYRPGEFVRRGDHTQRRIFLTFDDCFDARIVSQVADIANREGVRITYFPIGEQVARNKSLYGELIRKGHAVENHTWNHGNLKNKTREQVVEELLMQRDVVRQAAQTAGINNYPQVFVRPPGGAGKTDPEVVSVTRQYGYVIAMWSSDPQGFRRSVTTDMIVQRATNDLENGMILLQHTRPKDLEALPRIIRAAKARGFAMDETMRNGIKTTVYPSNVQAQQPVWSPERASPV